MVKPRGLKPFSVKNIVSNSERRNSGGKFFPICDLKLLPDYELSGDNDNASHVMYKFAQMWFNSGMELYSCKYSNDSKYSNLCNIVIVYCFRHCIELCLKSYKMLSGDFDSKKLNNHDVKKLLSEDLKSALRNYADNDGCVGDADIIINFLRWLYEFEGYVDDKGVERHNESAYRYALCGFNPIVNKYVNLELFLDYTYYILNVFGILICSKSK